MSSRGDRFASHLIPVFAAVVTPYALLAYSHDGSMAFNIRLTTVRVVCQNTLSLAIHQRRLGNQFRRSHSSSIREHAQAAQDFFTATLKEFEQLTGAFKSLAAKACKPKTFEEILTTLFPDPTRPQNADKKPALQKAWETKLADVRAARATIANLRQHGKGMELNNTADTYWGVLNAVTEFIDHHKEVKDGHRLAYTLLGDGMDLKARAYKLIHEKAAAA